MMTIGRRTIAAIDEEYRLAEAGRAATSSSTPDDKPSSATRAGPSTSAGAGPSTSPGVPPSPLARPPSPVIDPHHPLESIDDYTILMDDVDTTQSPLLQPTPLVPTTSRAIQEDITAPLPMRQYTRKRSRAHFDPGTQPPARLQLPHDPPPQLQPIPPQTQPQVQEGRRKNPTRNRRVPACGTE